MRSLAHINETIAIKSFQHALMPNMVPHSIEQGKDYGTDFIVDVFNRKGNFIKRYNAQIKYLPNSQIVYPKNNKLLLKDNSCLDTIYADPSYIPHTISLFHLKQYIDIDASAFPTIYVLANQNNLFYIWINDLYKYYLNWISKKKLNQKRLTIYFSELRSFYKWKSGYRNPTNPNYEGVNSFLLHGTSRYQGNWIGDWCSPETVDSISNISISMYLQNVRTRTSLIKYGFDVEGFWKFLIAQKKDWLFFVFAKFLGLLEPSPKMIEWALKVISDFRSHFDIPVAFQIISNTKNKKNIEFVFSRIFDKIEHLMPHFYMNILSENNIDYDERFSEEFISAVSKFLSNCIIKHHYTKAQQKLVHLFRTFSFSFHVPNAFANALSDLACNAHLINDDSLKELYHLCGMSEKKNQKQLSKEILETNYKWYVKDVHYK